MQLSSANAILLDVRDLGDRDRIAAFLTADRGQIRGVARGARRKYSRFSGLLQPLAKVRITWFEKEGNELVRLSDVDLLRPAERLQADLEGNVLGGVLADQMMEFAQENENSEPLWRLLDSTLERLLEGGDRGVALRYYEAWVLRLAGIFPPPRECPVCGRPFTADEGALLPAEGDALLCEDCVAEAPGGRIGALRVSPAALGFLRAISRAGLAEVEQWGPPRTVLTEVGRVCARVRRSFLGHELRSYGVMRQMGLSL